MDRKIERQSLGERAFIIRLRQLQIFCFYAMDFPIEMSIGRSILKLLGLARISLIPKYESSIAEHPSTKMCVF